jgi:hypothetical protein
MLVALTQGLAGAELAARLGSSRASVNRRWALGLRAVLDGLRPAHGSTPAPAPTSDSRSALPGRRGASITTNRRGR